jgi:hypothetical protein
MARVMRRRTAVHNLLVDLTRLLMSVVPADGMRYDLGDEAGKLWSRVVRPGGQEPERPGLGAVTAIRSKEAFSRTEDEGTHGVSIPLGLGDPNGRIVLKRKSGAFTDDEVEVLKAAADLFTIGLRGRLFDPPPKPRSPFDDEERPMV